MSARILEYVVGKRTEGSPIRRLSDREWSETSKYFFAPPQHDFLL
jgi:hypothetical protein